MSFYCRFIVYLLRLRSLSRSETLLFVDYSKLHEASVRLMNRGVKYLNRHRPVFNNMAVGPKIAV